MALSKTILPVEGVLSRPSEGAVPYSVLAPELHWALSRLGMLPTGLLGGLALLPGLRQPDLIPGQGQGGIQSLAPPGGGGLASSPAEGHRCFFMDWLLAQAFAQPELGSAYDPIAEPCPDDCSTTESSDPSEMDLSVSEETVGPEKSPAEDGLPPMLELRITELEKEQAQLKQVLQELVKQTLRRLSMPSE
eukprot:RCo004960